MCLKVGSLKNQVRRATPDERDRFQRIFWKDERGNIWCPFTSLSSGAHAQQARSDSSPFICLRCVRLFRKFAKVETDEIVSETRRKEVETEKKQFLVRRKKEVEKLQVTLEPHPECFLANKGNVQCSSSSMYNLFRPTRLCHEPDTIRQMWCSLFASKVGVPEPVAREVMLRPESLRLCTVHTGHLTSCLQKIKKMGRICSVCNEGGSTRNPKEVTRFPWNTIRLDDEMVCIVEDSLAIFKGPNLRPSDIKFICDSCRRIVCREIDMRANVPRDHLGPVHGRRKKPRADYGPTPRAIRNSIRFVREELKKKGNFVVFLKAVREQYEVYLRETDEQDCRLKDDRSLKKYIQPYLAASRIHLMLAAQKLGSFFCTTEKFVELAKMAKRPSYAPLQMTPAAEGRLDDQFAAYMKSRQTDIANSTWKLSEFIRAIPKLLWWRHVELLCAERHVQLMRKYRSTAALRNTSYDEQWPCNPLQCPDDMKTLPNYEFTFAVSLYFTIERDVFLRSERRTRGPINTSLSLVALTNTNVGYLSLLNRIGCTSSYQKLDSWRKCAIDDRKRLGPFQELKPGSFVVVGIDNVNMRASHSLNVYGLTYLGFDGLAMQAVNPNESFDFEAYCDMLALIDPAKLRPREIQMPSKPLSSSRTEFITENFLSRSTDPDIVGFKWLAVGLAVSKEENIATEDEKKQSSLRKVLIDGLKGRTGGKARVECVDVRACYANDEFEIVRLLESIEDHFNPFSCDRMTLIGVVGDQPIFKILFRLWLRSLIKKTRLCRWMVPIPGGFHIDKQALVALIKICLAGSGFEEIAQFSGLPKKKQEAIVTYGHYRKSRRLLSQYTAAQILRLAEVVADCDPDLLEKIRLLKRKSKKKTAFPVLNAKHCTTARTGERKSGVLFLVVVS